MEMAIVKQIVPLQPVEDHIRADIHTAACGGPHAAAGGYALKGSCILWKAYTRAGSSQELCPMERSPCRRRFSGRNCGLWGTHSGGACS